jgi:hypothetical protein
MGKVLEFKMTNGNSENQILGLGGDVKCYHRITDIANGKGKLSIEIEFGNNQYKVQEIDETDFVQGENNACLNLAENTSNLMKLTLDKGSLQLGTDKQNLVFTLQFTGPGKTKENGGE